MKELSLYEIRDIARESGRAVYTAAQLSALLGIEIEKSRVYSSRLVKKGLANRLVKGKISFSDNDFVNSVQLVEPSYISMDSALLFHNFSMQVPRNIQLVTTLNTINYPDLGLEYHLIPNHLFFGYERINLGISYTMVASPEKALIDGYYLGKYDEIDIKEYGIGLNFDGLLDQLNQFSGKGAGKLKEAILSLIRA